MDIFEGKTAKPMLFSGEEEPFNSPDYIYELKLDGERCIAYLDENETILINKRNVKMLSKFPELSNIHKQAKKRCILDGELMVSIDGRPNFDEVKRRSLTSNKVRIETLSKNYPATFTAFDILYYDKQITNLPLIERKKILKKAFDENDFLAHSRFIEEEGVALYNLTVEQDLEGIVAKRKDSTYQIGARTKDWVKVKNLKDDDFVVCGYIIEGGNAVASIILGQYDKKGKMIYKGHITLSLSRDEFKIIKKEAKSKCPFETPEPNAVYIKPNLVVTAKFMDWTINGGLRQPSFKGLRFDKVPSECIVRVNKKRRNTPP